MLLLGSFTSLWLFLRLENDAVGTLVDLVSDRGVTLDKRRGLRGLLTEMEQVREQLVFAQAQERELLRTRAQAEIALQVSHDIRSPLGALLAVVGRTERLPEDIRQPLKLAADRIRDIANGLLQEARHQKQLSNPPGTLAAPSLDTRVTPECSVENVALPLEAAVGLCRIALGRSFGILVENDLSAGVGLFARFQTSDFERVVSNLLNNAIESLSGAGRVAVRLFGDEAWCVLEVCDTGCGIPSDKLKVLGQRGASFGKEEGSGLGLYHAFETIRSWGGTISIRSQVNAGTQVEVRLPRATAPDWHVDALDLSVKSRILVLDDDQPIHELWAARFSGREVIHCYSFDEALAWFRSSIDVKDVFFLVDYHLAGSQQSGLDFLEMIGGLTGSVLVTSAWGAEMVRNRCLKLGVGLLPKPLASAVPIIFTPQTRSL